MTDFVAYNNARFKMTANLSEFADLYDLPHSIFYMQVRRTVADPVVQLSFASDGSQPDVISYDANSRIMTATTTIERVRELLGEFRYDYGFVAPGLEFTRCDGGALYFDHGVTLLSENIVPGAP